MGGGGVSFTGAATSIIFVATNILASILLSRQKTCFVVFVAMKMILMAAPAGEGAG